jgi:nicotinamide phosphoribosyltransferase
MGSDTVEGVFYARKYYNEPMAGFSIPAAEHSTITSWGRDHEVDAYRNMITLFAKPGSLVAVVSDSYDIMNAASNIWGGLLKDEVIASGATIVVRPDSGDPHLVPIQVIEALGEKFGFTVNSKGYKVLPSCVRVIQGDGITITSLPIILDNLLNAGWAADNIAFGMGGGLLQQVNRDTFKFAMKCSCIRIDGVWHDVYKDPVGDHSKQSKRGMLALVHNDGTFKTVPHFGHAYEDELRDVFNTGDVQRTYTFTEVRENSNKEW